MIRNFVFMSVLALSSPFARAGQVLLSCDLRGIGEFGDVEVKHVDEGFRVNVFMRNAEDSFYSSVWTMEEVPSKIELSQFSIFNKYPNALLREAYGKWFFTADQFTTTEVVCVHLK